MKIKVEITGLNPLAAAITHLADAWALQSGYCPDYEPREDEVAPEPEAAPASPKKSRTRGSTRAEGEASAKKSKPEAPKDDSATVAADKAAQAKTTGRLGKSKAETKPEPPKAEVIEGEVMPKGLTRAEVSALTMDTARKGPIVAPYVVAYLHTFGGAKNAKSVPDADLPTYTAGLQAFAAAVEDTMKAFGVEHTKDVPAAKGAEFAEKIKAAADVALGDL